MSQADSGRRTPRPQQERNPQEPRGQEANQQEPRGQEAHLLVVDDEANIRDLLAAALRFAGFSVTTAKNGNEARSEEHTSELQSRGHLVCRLLLEKKKIERKATLDHTLERTER